MITELTELQIFMVDEFKEKIAIANRSEHKSILKYYLDIKDFGKIGHSIFADYDKSLKQYLKENHSEVLMELLKEGKKEALLSTGVFVFKDIKWWLSDAHGIDVGIYEADSSGYVFSLTSTAPGNARIWQDGNFSYEEAMSKGIDKAFEIVKNRKAKDIKNILYGQTKVCQ